LPLVAGEILEGVGENCCNFYVGIAQKDMCRVAESARTAVVLASDRHDPGLKAPIFGPFSGAEAHAPAGIADLQPCSPIPVESLAVCKLAFSQVVALSHVIFPG
jgi:hypothetical protein